MAPHSIRTTTPTTIPTTIPTTMTTTVQLVTLNRQVVPSVGKSQTILGKNSNVDPTHHTHTPSIDPSRGNLFYIHKTFDLCKESVSRAIEAEAT